MPLAAPPRFPLRTTTHRRRQRLSQPTQEPLDAAASRKDPSIAPAHGGVGDTATGGGEPGSREEKESAATAAMLAEKVSGLAGGGVGTGGVLGPGEGRRGKNRVTMLGTALDGLETRAGGPGGKGGKGVKDRPGEKVWVYAALVWVASCQYIAALKRLCVQTSHRCTCPAEYWDLRYVSQVTDRRGRP